jgi:hypothetical protein
MGVYRRATRQMHPWGHEMVKREAGEYSNPFGILLLPWALTCQCETTACISLRKFEAGELGVAIHDLGISEP